MARWRTAVPLVASAVLLAGCGLILDLDPSPSSRGAPTDAGGPMSGLDAGTKDAAAHDAAPQDAAPPDAARCVSSPGLCDGGDDACSDGLVGCAGECVDVETDGAHCGTCGNACFVDDHGIIECVEGACTVLDCGDWYWDCNMDPADGCERYILTETDCGACDVACEPDETCVGGSCDS